MCASASRTAAQERSCKDVSRRISRWSAPARPACLTDALLSHCDATVALVDRRHAPGGHWIDTYPFLRLHQPFAFYGVSSVPVGRGAVDQTDPNAGLNAGLNASHTAGFHGAAGAEQLRAYCAQVMDQHFLPTGRVRHLPCSDHSIGPDGRHLMNSRLTGAVQ